MTHLCVRPLAARLYSDVSDWPYVIYVSGIQSASLPRQMHQWNIGEFTIAWRVRPRGISRIERTAGVNITTNVDERSDGRGR